MSRRRFLQLGLGLAGASLLGHTTYTVGWERYRLHVTRWRVPLPRLPQELNGLRLVHLTDVHLSPRLPEDYLQEAVLAAGELEGHALLLTGDVLSGPTNLLPRFRAAFTQVAAPGGKYAVLGNHDHYLRRAEPVREFLTDCGWQVLDNRSAPLPGTEERLWLVGLDDPVTSRDDLAAALAGVPPEAVRVVMSHTPDVIGPVAEAGADLMVAGHTHGGQVVLPLLGPPIVPSIYGQQYAWGLFDRQGTRLEVSRGIGLVPPRVRYRCPPEVAVLILEQGDWPLPSGGPPRSLRPVVRPARRVAHRLLRELRDH